MPVHKMINTGCFLKLSLEDTFFFLPHINPNLVLVDPFSVVLEIFQDVFEHKQGTVEGQLISLFKNDSHGGPRTTTRY